MLLEVLVHEGDRHAALADGRRDPLDRPAANVAAREDARHARLQEIRIAVEPPTVRGGRIQPGDDVTAAVECDLLREPSRLGVGADEDVEPAGVEPRRLTARRVVDVDRLQRGRAVGRSHLRPSQHADVRANGQLVDQIARHALLEPVAAADDRHALRVTGEEQRRLTCRVAGADDVHVDAVAAQRLAARGAVRDALPGQPFESLDGQLPPGDAAGEDDRPRGEHVAAVELDLTRVRVDPGDRAGDQDLGAEPPRLLQRTTGELVARDARREAEVVLDPG